MKMGIKDFIRKDCRDIIDICRSMTAIAQEVIDTDCEVSFPLRIAEARALINDMEQWAIVLHGGRGNYDRASESVGRIDG